MKFFLILILISFLFFGCSLSQNKNQQKTEEDNEIIDQQVVDFSSDDFDSNTIDKSFLKEYCQLADYKNEVWECFGLYNYLGGPQKFMDDCYSIGYYFECFGSCASGKCYLATEESSKQCFDSEECDFKWCKPIDEECLNDCVGKCSTVFPPNPCSLPQTFKMLRLGNVIEVNTGGAFCN